MGSLSSAGRASALQAEGHRFQALIGPIKTRWIPEWPKGGGAANLLATPSGGSNPSPIHLPKGLSDVAQLAEQLICDQQVIDSSPIIGNKGKY